MERLIPRILEMRPEGLYCSIGDFYIDPSRSVGRAIITHGHTDHLRKGAQALSHI